MTSNFKINCKQATYLISKQQETKISFFDRIKLGLHLKICGCCSLFKKQINKVTSMLKTKPLNNVSLSNAKKEIIKEELQKEMLNG